MLRKPGVTAAASFFFALLKIISVSATDIQYAYCPGAILDDTKDQAKLIVAANKAHKAVFGRASDFKLFGHKYPEPEDFNGLNDERRLEEEVETVHNQIMKMGNSTKSASITPHRRLDSCTIDCRYCGVDLGWNCGGVCLDGCRRRKLRSEPRKLIATADEIAFENELLSWVDRFKIVQLMGCDFEIR